MPLPLRLPANSPITSPCTTPSPSIRLLLLPRLLIPALVALVVVQVLPVALVEEQPQ